MNDEYVWRGTLLVVLDLSKAGICNARLAGEVFLQCDLPLPVFILAGAPKQDKEDRKPKTGLATSGATATATPFGAAASPFRSDILELLVHNQSPLDLSLFQQMVQLAA